MIGRFPDPGAIANESNERLTDRIEKLNDVDLSVEFLRNGRP